MRLRRLLLPLALLVTLIAPVTARAGSGYTNFREEWISTSDPLVSMHADVVRAGDADWGARQPVILVATPYGNHSGQTTWTPSSNTRQNGRFQDFLSSSDALNRGYTYVVVDLPGYGGSSGCSDLGGPLERAAVKRAVEWAANQPWSSGKVALFGKSYDAWTGLMGVAERPQGLAAVVAMEPVYSPYTVDFAHGVRNGRSFLLPALYAQIEANPGSFNDSPQYQANSVIRPQCYAINQANWLNDDEAASFWQERNLPADSIGSTVPVFATQGLLETNTVSRGALSYFNSLAGSGNHAMLGQFGHVRGWEWDAGRPTFIDEVMRFLDLNLKGIASPVATPRITVQDSLGRYRSEAAYPPADAHEFTTQLIDGRYVDGVSTNDDFNTEVLSIDAAELTHPIWMTGEPHVKLTVVTQSPRTNISVRLYDVEADYYGTEVSREAFLIRKAGESTIELGLMPQDWIFEKGHRIAVQIGTPSTGRFAPVPTGGVVTVKSATISIPFLTSGRTRFEGTRISSFLAQARRASEFVPANETHEIPFSIPGPINIGPR